MKHRILHFVAGAMSLLLAGGLFAQEIVDTAYVAEAAKRGAIVWDVRDADAYKAGHIPGAVNIGNAGDVLRDPNTEDFVATERIEKLLNDGGIDLGKEVIVYSRKGDPYAYWGLTAVRYFGGRKGRVYHGGLDDWSAAGQPVSKEATKLAPVSQKLVVVPGEMVFTKDVVAKLKDPNVQFVDARTPKEYSGEDIRSLRGGHLPGAKSIPYEQNWVDPATGAKLASKQVRTRDGMALKTQADLKALYAGLDPNKETVVYCQSGVRASETATVLRDLGFTKVQVFEESWLGYGNTLDAPVEGVKFVNVGALKSQIRSLESAVEELQAQVAAMQKK